MSWTVPIYRTSLFQPPPRPRILQASLEQRPKKSLIFLLYLRTHPHFPPTGRTGPEPCHTFARYTTEMSAMQFCSRPLAFAILLSYYPCLSMAVPLPHLYKRDMPTGAKAGLGIGIAVAAILVIGISIFVVVHIRRSRHIKAINKERAMLAGEKPTVAPSKRDTFAPQPGQPALPRRNKSVKDRLMGPLYRNSMIDMMPLPKARLPSDNPNRVSTMSTQSQSPSFLNKPWAGSDSSPRPSFSSRRATRMMMMM